MKEFPCPISWEVSKTEIVRVIGIAAYFLQAPIKDYISDILLGIPAFFGTSISLIISFKLSQSYESSWEARKIWGSIVSMHYCYDDLLVRYDQTAPGVHYRIKLEAWTFLLAEGLAIFISQLTLSLKSIKAALANPVDSLRNE